MFLIISLSARLRFIRLAVPSGLKEASSMRLGDRRWQKQISYSGTSVLDGVISRENWDLHKNKIHLLICQNHHPFIVFFIQRHNCSCSRYGGKVAILLENDWPRCDHLIQAWPFSGTYFCPMIG